MKSFKYIIVIFIITTLIIISCDDQKDSLKQEVKKTEINYLQMDLLISDMLPATLLINNLDSCIFINIGYPYVSIYDDDRYEHYMTSFFDYIELDSANLSNLNNEFSRVLNETNNFEKLNMSEQNGLDFNSNIINFNLIYNNDSLVQFSKVDDFSKNELKYLNTVIFICLDKSKSENTKEYFLRFQQDLSRFN